MGLLQMIDLSPQPQDETSDGAELQSGPRHDTAVRNRPAEHHHRAGLFTYESAEASIQFLSRWAGPIVLAGTLVLLGWWFVA